MLVGKHDSDWRSWGLQAVGKIDCGTVEGWLALDLVKEVALRAAAIMNASPPQKITAQEAVKLAWRALRQNRRDRLPVKTCLAVEAAQANCNFQQEV